MSTQIWRGDATTAREECRYSDALQRQLLDSYMELQCDDPRDASDLRLGKALLPLLCAIQGVNLDVTVVPGRTIAMRARRTTRWNIPEDLVDPMFATLMAEGTRLRDALLAIEAIRARG